MLDLFKEFKTLTALLAERNIDYALCGGLAMAVYGTPRATIDIDLLIQRESLNAVKALSHTLGYIKEALPMKFADGAIEISRLSKFDEESGDLLTLDLLLVTPAIQTVWDSRKEIEWENGKIRVVSREGLIALKSLRGSGQDLDDIKNLREHD